VAVDPHAAALGLLPGLSLTSARAQVPDLVVADAAPHEDHIFLTRLAGLCESVTPLYACDGDCGLILDITGCAHLFGSEERLYRKVMAQFTRLKLHVRGVIASTPDAARALARYHHATIVAEGEDVVLGQELPVKALGLPDEATTALKRAGLKTLGDLVARPSQALSARFGQQAMTALDRILGREDIRITPLRALPDCMAEQRFADPFTQMDALIDVLARLADVVATQLDQRGLGGRRFEASFFRSDGEVRRLVIDTAQALRDSAIIMRLFRLKIDALAEPIDPGFGFDALRLAVSATETLSVLQPTFDARVHDMKQFAVLVDQLGVRFGYETVQRFVADDTHDPVRAARRVPALFTEAGLPWTQALPGDPPLRPLTLFERPQPIEALAEVPDGPPLRFRWRRVLHDVARAEGPERIAPEWWRPDSATQTRDYYRVEDSCGRRFWVYREGLFGQGGPPRWYMHGLFA
jgi:protein ImuB